MYKLKIHFIIDDRSRIIDYYSYKHHFSQGNLV